MRKIIRKVGLEDVKFLAPIGFYEEERLLKNIFLVNIWVEIPGNKQGDTENLENTIDYTVLYDICAVEFSKPAKLIETVAQQIIDHIINQFPFVKAVCLKINKQNPPIKGELQSSFVEFFYRVSD